jgi:D-alanyl-D-alanine carboxypeptidase
MSKYKAEVTPSFSSWNTVVDFNNSYIINELLKDWKQLVTVPAIVTTPGDKMEPLEESLLELLRGCTSIWSSAACWIETVDKDFACAYGEFEGSDIHPENTIFSAASISKLVVAVAVMQCIEDTLINLEENMSEYLPPSCPFVNPFFKENIITAEMLLRHTSSLQDDEEQLRKGSKFRVDGGQAMNLSLQEYAESYVVGNKAIWSRARRPGSVISYSNAGFTILGLAVQTVRQQPLQDVIRERIFAPLGMRRSSFFLRDALAAQGCVVAQPTAADGPSYYEVAEWPAAQLRSTAPDLLRFLRSFTRRGPPAVLPAAAVARMLPPGGARGLAFWGSDFPYSSRTGAWEHGGFMQGIRSHAFVWPGGAAVVLFNAEDPYERPAAALIRRLISASPGEALPAPPPPADADADSAAHRDAANPAAAEAPGGAERDGPLAGPASPKPAPPADQT